MKTIICTFLFVFAMVSMGHAQDTTGIQPRDQVKDQTQTDEGRKPISSADLPEAITNSLKGQHYSGWKISSAYRVMAADPNNTDMKKEIYIVELKSGAETKSVGFDSEGKELKDLKMDDEL